MAPRTELSPFNSYQVTYAVTNPLGKDYARIDFFNAASRVGQILFGSAIQPGSHAGLQNGEVHLYFPLSHFDSVCQVLRCEQNLALFVSLDDADSAATIGGVTTSPVPA